MLVRIITITLFLSSLILPSSLMANPAIEAFDKNKFDKAKQLFLKQKSSPEQQYYLGRIAIAEADLDEAEERLEEAVKAAPEQADYHYWYGSVCLRQAANASIFSAPGYASDGKEHLLRAIELDPSHIQAMRNMIAFYSQAPSIAGGSIEKALQMADKLEAVSIKDGLISKLDIYQKEEQIDKLNETAKQIEEKFNKDAQALVAVGFSYQQNEQFEKAFRTFQAASEIDSTDSAQQTAKLTSLYQIGRTAVLSKQNLDIGKNALEKYMTMQAGTGLPSKDWARYRLAMIYHALGNLEKTRALIDEIEDDQDEALTKQLKKFKRKLKS
ncbi:lipopolysaccharide assembly protein LapB [Aliikangiella sp. G2MR2-5]|uniref:tetratricopeptide repeat protein n=1 Tax=Aliikangiella sp. G2MR2-5 TaxID=2788943 RepID=UPI0018AA2E13|nr:tetratricopeptide repeat protein [Aliikangiella sp. G2MR2-5]